MQRVLHVVGLRGYGGLEKLFVAYAVGMRQAGRPVAAAVKHALHPATRAALQQGEHLIYRQKYLGPVRLPGRLLQAANRRRILRAVRPARIVFWSSLPTPDWLRQCRRWGAGVVYYDHGRCWQLDRARATPVLDRVDRVITVSAAGRRILRERLGYAGPVSVVHNGVAPPPFREFDATPASGPLRIVFAGRLVDVKGTHLLLHAAARLRERGVPFHLSVAGDGPSRPALEALTERLGLTGYVEFRGLVIDMDAFYRGADVLVMPSLHESFGLTAVEAGLCGLPVVASAVDGLAEVVRDGEGGVLLPMTLPLSACEALGGGRYQVPEQVYDPLADRLTEPRAVDPAALADALTDLAGDRTRLRALGEAAHARCRELFSFDGYLRRINAALDAPTAGP